MDKQVGHIAAQKRRKAVMNLERRRSIDVQYFVLALILWKRKSHKGWPLYVSSSSSWR